MCLLRGYNPLYWIYIKGTYWLICAYWTKICLLTESVPIEWKSVYWPKMCLLNENVFVDQKCAYWMKMCLLNENMYIKRKGAYWPKMYQLNKNVSTELKRCLLIEKMALRGYNHLGINSGSYSFGNFFSFIFFRNTKNLD